MDDTVYRKDVIKALEDMSGGYSYIETTTLGAITTIRELPSAQPEYRMDEWCTDCKEYDHERHCCPRFNHVIRTTLQEAQERKKGKWIVSFIRGNWKRYRYKNLF